MCRLIMQIFICYCHNGMGTFRKAEMQCSQHWFLFGLKKSDGTDASIYGEKPCKLNSRLRAQ